MTICGIVQLPLASPLKSFEASSLSSICQLSKNPQHSEYMTWYFVNNTDRFTCYSYTDDIKASNHRLTLDYPSDLIMMNCLFREFNFDPSMSYTASEILDFLDDLKSLQLTVPMNFSIK